MSNRRRKLITGAEYQRLACERLRQFRERQKSGAKIARVCVPAAVLEGLIDAGFLGAWDADDPAKLKAAIEKVLAQLVA